MNDYESWYKSKNIIRIQHTIFLFLFFLSFCLFWGRTASYGGSQARALIGAIATGLRQSHSNTGSELRLQPTPQLMAMQDL